MIILDIDMPKNCWQCTLNTQCSECEGYPDSCAAKGFLEGKKCEYGKDNDRPDWCPIVGEISKETDADWKCFMREEKEAAYKVGYEEGLKAGNSAFNEGSKDEGNNQTWCTQLRAEIERGKTGLDIEFNSGIDYAIQIIDKYKAESEGV